MKKVLQLNKSFRVILFIILLNIVGMGKTIAQSFTVGDLRYSVNNDGVSVTVLGHVSYDPSGELIIPETVAYDGNSYSVTSIGDDAFYGCSGFTGSLIIPNSVTSIGSGAFSECSGFSESLIIPNSVTQIGNYAFADCSGFTGSLTIPTPVTSIENGVFSGCSGFSGSLVIPNSVTQIGDYAFKDCSGLTGSLVIPNSVTSIGYEALSGCSGLTGSLVIGNSVSMIGYEAFIWCDFDQIIVEEGNPVFDSRNDCNAVVETEANTIFLGCKNTIIPNTVTSIGNGAFGGVLSLESITIPNSIVSIGGYAFIWCNGLTTIDIPNSVTSIGGDAFYGCSGLTSVDIPNSITSIAFGTFQECTGLVSVNIPNSVVEIGDQAFFECSSLLSFSIPASVTSIGIYAFRGTEWFNNMPDGIIYKDGCCIGYKGEAPIGSLSFAEGTRLIADYAFSFNCGEVSSLTIPNSVISIGCGALDGCRGVESINVEAGNPVYDSRENCNAIIETLTDVLLFGCANTIIPNTVTSIGDGAFGCVFFLHSITIPNSVLSIGDGAFSSCSLDSITIPNSVLSIGENAFGGCWYLSSLTIGNSVTIIGGGAFLECLSLTSVTIPNSVISIGYGAFEKCYNLKSVIIGSSVDSIGRHAFEECRIDTVVCWSSTPPELEDRSFDENIPKLIVACGAGSAYSVSEWANYFESIEEDCDDVSEENDNVEAFIFPNPTSGMVKIEADDLRSIGVFNILGQQIYSGHADGDEFEIDLGGYESGIYLIRMETASGVITKRVVLTR